MKRWHVAALALALLAALGAAALAIAVLLGERKLERRVEVRVVPVPYARDPAALAQGKYLFQTRGCAECHGASGAGRVLVDGANGLYVKTPDITAGPGGVTGAYTEADWVRAIRHGVSPKGHALVMMPSEEFNRLNDADFAALVAYARSLPPATGGAAEVRLPFFMKALYAVGSIRDAAEKIDHRKPPAGPVAVAATVEHGAYVANMCIGCHGAGLAGGPIPGTPSDWPAAANLTPGAGSAMVRYDTPGKFSAMMRTGKRPDGSTVSKVMPFGSLAALNDVDLDAMYAYLQTLSPRRMGER